MFYGKFTITTLILIFILSDFLTEFVIAKMSSHAVLGLLKCLADWYWENNNQQIHVKFFEPDIYLTLFYAMIGLEADFCRRISRNIMSKREFIKACQYSYEKEVLDDELLGSVYDFVLLEGLNLGFPSTSTTSMKRFSQRNGKFLCYAIKNASYIPTKSNTTKDSLGGKLEILRI